MEILNYFKSKKTKKNILYFCKENNIVLTEELKTKLIKFQKDFTIIMSYPRDNKYMKIITWWMGNKGMI